VNDHRAVFRLSFRGLLSSAPDFSIATVFMIVWVDPQRFGDQSVRHFTYVMLIEFIVIHSTGFLGHLRLMPWSRAKKARSFVGLVLFYSLFAGGFALACGKPWPLLAFWGLSLAKFPSVVFDPLSGKQGESTKQAWAVNGAAYVLGAFITTLLPVPRLGITREIVAQQGFTSSGLWPDQPHRAIAFGALYFTVLGLFELMAHGRAAHSDDPEC